MQFLNELLSNTISICFLNIFIYTVAVITRFITDLIKHTFNNYDR